MANKATGLLSGWEACELLGRTIKNFHQKAIQGFYLTVARSGRNSEEEGYVVVAADISSKVTMKSSTKSSYPFRFSEAFLINENCCVGDRKKQLRPDPTMIGGWIWGR